MQEEITQKTIALSISTGKMTSRVLLAAIRELMRQQKQKTPKGYKGKQTMKQLVKQNTALSNIEITDQNIKSFERTARKYGIDYALKKDVSETPPRYLVFFKGRDVDVINMAFKEYVAKQMKHKDKPSIREMLSQARGLVTQNHRQREKVKERSAER